jgi:peptidoglycan hydrolase-like protein with peptidoglycan-binding domain
MASNNVGPFPTSGLDEWGFESPFAQAQDFVRASSGQERGNAPWDDLEQDTLAWDGPAWENQPSLDLDGTAAGISDETVMTEESEAEATESEDFAGPDDNEAFSEEESFDAEAFPSGAALQTVSGPTGKDQEHWDPNRSGEPLYSTGPSTHGIRLSANFTVKELVTSGGQSAVVARISPALVRLLQAIRDRAGKSVKITSGYRSWARNKAVYARRNAKPTLSRHCSGQAADIKVAGLTGLQLAQLAIDAGGPGLAIGIGASYIHVDVRGSWTVWTYFGKGSAKDLATLTQIRAYREARRRHPATASVTDPATAQETAEHQEDELEWTAEDETDSTATESREELSESEDQLDENYEYENHDAEAASSYDARFAPALQLLEVQIQEESVIAQLRGSLGFVFGAPLKPGTAGDTVTALQSALNRLCFRIKIDGIFGPTTEKALKAFQANAGLQRTGIADGATRQAILTALSAAQATPAAADLPDAIVRAATGELPRWRPPGGRILQETDPEAMPMLRSYWGAVGFFFTDSQLQNRAWQELHPWSAAFISWVMCHAGAGSTFSYNPAHYTYVRQAMLNTDNAVTTNPFWAYPINKVAPEPGDLVCKARTDKKNPTLATWSTLKNRVWPLHCDVVTSTPKRGVITVVGGNVGGTVGEKGLHVHPDGKLVPGDGRLLVVRCRGRAAGL